MARISPGSSRRPSNHSTSRSRASSAHSQEHSRIGISNRFNTTPASDMFPKPITSEFARPSITHAPITPDLGYDVLDVVNQMDHEDIYKVPINNTPSSSYSSPPHNRPVPIPKQSTSKSPPPLPNPATKQAPTRTQHDFEMIGYEKMDPKSEKQQHHHDSDSYEFSYYHMKPKDELPPKTHTGPSPEKKFTTMPWMMRDKNSQKSSSLPRHHIPKPTPDIPPKREDPTFAEIPNVTPKSLNDSEGIVSKTTKCEYSTLLFLFMVIVAAMEFRVFVALMPTSNVTALKILKPLQKRISRFNICNLPHFLDIKAPYFGKELQRISCIYSVLSSMLTCVIPLYSFE